MKKYLLIPLFLSVFLALVSCKAKDSSLEKTKEIKTIITISEESKEIKTASSISEKATETTNNTTTSEASLSETISEQSSSVYPNYINGFDDLSETARLRIENKMYELAKDYMNKQKNDYDSVVFEKTLSLGKLADRKYDLIDLSKIYFLSLKEYGVPSFGAYNKLIYIYKTRIYDFMHTDGVDFYFPLYLDNILIERDGNLSYNLEDIKVDETMFSDNIEDYESLIIRLNSSDYNGVEIKERE